MSESYNQTLWNIWNGMWAIVFLLTVGGWIKGKIARWWAERKAKEAGMRLTIDFSEDPNGERVIAKCLEFPKIEANGFDAKEALEELIYLLDMIEALPTLEKLEEALHDR